MSSLFDLLADHPELKEVALLWSREICLKERVRLGGRSADLIYKGKVLDVSRSFFGPYDKAVEWAIFNDCWDGMHSAAFSIDGEKGRLSASYLSVKSDCFLRPLDMGDFSPQALDSLELIEVISGDSKLWRCNLGLC